MSLLDAARFSDGFEPPYILRFRKDGAVIGN
jgi:hypothetical protein